MPIYMKMDGVDGSVTAKGHEKWIELESAQMGVNRHITSPTGRGANREASVPSVSEVMVTKVQDCASTNLFRLSLWGEGKKVKIDFCKTDKDKFEPYLQLELEHTLISSYSCSGHGGNGHSRPMESLSMNFTKILFNTIAMDAKNATHKPDRAMYDLAAGKGS
jgi:type VI secretion system secreted protein Hcp